MSRFWRGRSTAGQAEKDASFGAGSCGGEGQDAGQERHRKRSPVPLRLWRGPRLPTLPGGRLLLLASLVGIAFVRPKPFLVLAADEAVRIVLPHAGEARATLGALPPFPADSLVRASSVASSGPTAALIIRAPKASPQAFFVAFVRTWDDDALVATAYLRRGSSIALRLPVSSYRVVFAAGVDWEGEDGLFGPLTVRYVTRSPVGLAEVHSGGDVEIVLIPGPPRVAPSLEALPSPL